MKRIDAWEEGKYDMLVQDTEKELKSFLSTNQRGATPQQRAKIFDAKLKRDGVKAAVNYIVNS